MYNQMCEFVGWSIMRNVRMQSVANWRGICEEPDNTKKNFKNKKGIPYIGLEASSSVISGKYRVFREKNNI